MFPQLRQAFLCRNASYGIWAESMFEADRIGTH
jgi:hypothetical protein